MARSKTELGSGADVRIRHMMAKNVGSREIGAALRASGVDVSDRTVARRMADLKKSGPATKTKGGSRAPDASASSPTRGKASQPNVAQPGPVVVPPDNVKATARDRQIDELLSTSLVWRRIQTAIASVLACHPVAGAAVVRALRGVQL